ncbi:MAG: hypothetical protein C0626_07085 [Arcobacter sp.]|uniref:BrnT family toxin n=1 Tax=uncultured Arcobacter sp. TaxID=165434 RepID=UPI000CC2ACB5|nr:BrnT family toxin [uncultured Arcobacter sp.]PLY10035.1 MAG: hypothetical protein C0626_07085 [Arcobacter sp.]
MDCTSCQYYRDLTFFNLGLRCMNKINSPKSGDFMVIKDSYFCEHYVEFQDNQFEWDENKNQKNIEKHGISFNRIYDLFADQHMVQQVEQPNKWEDLSNLDESVERNEGNLDPIRAKLTGSIDGKIYTAIYTFRDEVGKMRYRIISLRRAQKKEIQFYNNCKP